MSIALSLFEKTPSAKTNDLISLMLFFSFLVYFVTTSLYWWLFISMDSTGVISVFVSYLRDSYLDLIALSIFSRESFSRFIVLSLMYWK